MAQVFKTIKGKIIAIILAIVLVAGGVAGYFLLRKNGDPASTPLTFDLKTGRIVKNRVDNAQYLPNLDLLVQDAVSTAAPNYSNQLADLSFDLEDYRSIVDELAIITGTATRLDTSIMDVKEEIYTVLDMVPAFGRWFQLPRYFEAEHAQDGYNNYFYKLDYDRSTQKISITRMTWSYTCGAYNSTNNKIYSTYLDHDIKQYQILQANYYYNEENKEVVECAVVDFAKFYNKFYPIQCQYLANIQDTSTTKIQSVLRKDVETYPDKITDNPGGNIGREMDIDTYRDGGVMKKIVQLNYTDANNVELIKIEQNSNTNYYSDINTTNLAYYLKDATNAIYFVDAWDYYDEEASADDIELINMFHINPHNLSKESVMDSFTNSQYYTRQVMGTAGTSSNTVCKNCYNRVYDSGLLVYKCDHNKNQENVARAYREVIASSVDYQNAMYDMIPYSISRHLTNFAIGVGINKQAILDTSAGMCEELNNAYKFESGVDAFLHNVSKEFIENISLVKDVQEIYTSAKTKSRALEVEELNKSAVASVIAIESLTEEISVADNVVSVNATATVKSNILLEPKAKYSLGLVLYNRLRNIQYTLLTNYVEYNGGDLTLTLSGTYDLTSIVLEDKDVRSYITTDLTLGYALLKQDPITDIVCSNYTPAVVVGIVGEFSEFLLEFNGFLCEFDPYIYGTEFRISFSCEDMQNPEVGLKNEVDSTVTLPTGSRVYALLALLEVEDNDVVKTITIYHDGQKYYNMYESLVEGVNSITVADRAGNSTTITFVVELA